MWSPTSSPSGPPLPDGRLVVMAKYPEPGAVKTRLAAVLGADRACALYRAFVLDLADRLRALPLEVTWAYWPPHAPFPGLLPGWRCRPQQGDDLGERLAHVVASELARGGGPLVVVGADAPHLPVSCVTEAVEMLGAGADLVLGPATDGGYYLIGLHAVWPALFDGITWGTATVLAETLARADRLALRTHLLSPTFDVDDVDDLAPLRAILRDGRVHLPRTAALLASR